MRKIIFLLFVALSLGACKNESKEVKEAEKTTVEMIPEETVTVSTDKPTFKSEAAQQYVDAYDQFITNYKAAMDSKDQVKIQELNNEMLKLSAKGTEALKGLETEDATKLSEYMTNKSQELIQIQSLNK